jgi:hypothetical protein
MSAIWRCPVCEGVNRGGRTCEACGAVVPYGEPLRAVVRTRLPSANKPVPAVPPTPHRRELRELPTPEEMSRVDPDHLLTSPSDFKMTPLPGGCLASVPPTVVGVGVVRKGQRQDHHQAGVAVGMTSDRHDMPSQLPQVTGTSRPAQVWAKFPRNSERLRPLKTRRSTARR